MKTGSWILLDEVNLASDEVLNMVSTLVNTQWFYFAEKGEFINIHEDFWLFCCMNPHYSSAGKKKLPQSLWEKMTEFHIDEINQKDEILEILKQGLIGFDVNSICEFYIKFIKMLHNGEIWNGNTKPGVGLRNLSWAIRYIKSAVNTYSRERAVFEGLKLLFTPQFDSVSQ